MRLVGERPATAAVPVPERLTLWVLPAVALSVRVTAALRVPVADGVKVTLIVQVAPAATELPQLLVWVKSLGFVPVSAILVRLKAALAVLLRVMVWTALVAPTAWLANVRLVGERLATGSAPVPVPERLTAWGLPLALSATLSEAVQLPLAEGLKVTLIAQLAPAATELPQLLVWAKSLGLAPVSARLEMLKAALPVLLTVTV